MINPLSQIKEQLIHSFHRDQSKVLINRAITFILFFLFRTFSEALVLRPPGNIQLTNGVETELAYI
jgi:hypothetical protein